MQSKMLAMRMMSCMVTIRMAMMHMKTVHRMKKRHRIDSRTAMTLLNHREAMTMQMGMNHKRKDGRQTRTQRRERTVTMRVQKSKEMTRENQMTVSMNYRHTELE